MTMIKQDLNKPQKFLRCEGIKSLETNVWSVTIKGKNDCVALSDFEAMQVKMKFMPDIEMYNMTERHGFKVAYLHKEHRMQDIMPENVTWVGDKPPSQTYIKGVGPGMWGGAAKMMWEFQDLMEMDI